MDEHHLRHHFSIFLHNRYTSYLLVDARWFVASWQPSTFVKMWMRKKYEMKAENYCQRQRIVRDLRREKRFFPSFENVNFRYAMYHRNCVCQMLITIYADTLSTVGWPIPNRFFSSVFRFLHLSAHFSRLRPSINSNCDFCASQFTSTSYHGRCPKLYRSARNIICTANAPVGSICSHIALTIACRFPSHWCRSRFRLSSMNWKKWKKKSSSKIKRQFRLWRANTHKPPMPCINFIWYCFS